MTKALALIVVFGLAFTSAGQTGNAIPEKRQRQLDALVELIENDRILELATRILYPITRPNPIPDIESKEDFILYYHTLFDSRFKGKWVSTTFDSSNIMDRNTEFGVFNGEVWLNDDGQIKSINYHSKGELELLQNLHLETENKIYPNVEDWKSNLLVCQTDSFLIRIDLMDTGELRYISWSKPKTIEDKPDLILFDGKREFLGTGGGVTYTFKNESWTYSIDQVKLAKSEDKLGLYLRVYKNGKLKMNLKTEEIK